MNLSGKEKELLSTALAMIEVERAILKSEDNEVVGMLETKQTDLSERYETLRDEVDIASLNSRLWSI